ncbi:hypothetical protein YUYDRAFT_02462 [Streptomyces sp. ScaeMP-e48]|uniref:hypothetical protein n=1 Tax=Streptomyces sp. ScaeMP-e48 TaxID=1100823 RepID=UPI000823E3EF|nr:hypothetical protein [Streptomyces sp. ScaeMP-e48]SCK23111.1 hypothetical protein YUYDRAFT_02462 [Streptomyces sp. ScaeMP-e48]
MDAELAALAASGATTLVGLMVTDGWTQARARFARLLGNEQDDVEAELERSRAALVSAGGGSAAREEAERFWRDRIAALLDAAPGAAQELRVALAETAPQVHAEIHGGEFNGPVQLGGVQTNYFGNR